jgi:hypothetical protein
MITFFRQVALYLGFDLRISKATSNSDLENLISRMHPVKTDKDLIRIGSEKDGGYLIPNDLEGIEAIISPGVGNKQDFDLYFANKGVKVFMADASVDGPIENHSNFFFINFFLGALDNYKYISMETWCESIDIQKDADLILQMDIEGGEYEVLYNMPHDILNQFRIIIVEFHDLDMLWNKQFFSKFENSFLKLLDSHYIVHNHPNNCCPALKKDNIEIPPVLEMTFYRKDRAKKLGYVDKFPHKYDVECTEQKPLVLPKFWYKRS